MYTCMINLLKASRSKVDREMAESVPAGKESEGSDVPPLDQKQQASEFIIAIFHAFVFTVRPH